MKYIAVSATMNRLNITAGASLSSIVKKPKTVSKTKAIPKKLAEILGKALNRVLKIVTACNSG